MFAGFNLKIDKDSFFNEKDFESCKSFWENSLKEEDREQLKEGLENYVKTEELNGTEIQNDWFPDIDADIFISHSHKDKELAQAFAGWIKKTFNLTCFIDSDVWGYVDDLLTGMNDQFSDRRLEGDHVLYNYQSCNKVAEHVHMMLSAALQKMIDKAEAVILLNTDNSIQVNCDNKMNASYSPWIYSEILFTSAVRRTPLIVYRRYAVLEHAIREEKGVLAFAQLNILYEVSLDHLKVLTEDDLREWRKKRQQISMQEEPYSLDLLYQSTHPEELKYEKALYGHLGEPMIRGIKKLYKVQGVDQAKREEVRDYLICCGILYETHVGCKYRESLESDRDVFLCQEGIICRRCHREECPRYRKEGENYFQ